MRSVSRLLALILLALLASGCEQTGITRHSYLHPSGQIRYDLRLASYKRGLFFGSCGPSTYSLQWEYRVELKGAGPNYARESIELQDGDLHRIPLESGSILLDEHKRLAKIDVSILQHSKVQPFVHNGTYTMQMEP